ncbi:MAG: hypothetical protein CVT65_00850 [Actinobacteria bacterium HGW-Actinobacteria-5]|mgnify:FL=1|nr:MAG: hypothetical protein CVT65_00850 [Actinobacteria bacterium HGW-Actinobacteria-5]
MTTTAAPRRRHTRVAHVTGGALTAERTGFVIEALGSVTAVAELLEVSKSQPSRWRTGAEQPSPAKARELIDLDHVLARALLLWTPAVAIDWLAGSNAYLDGARPIDVLRIRGAAEVLDALDAAAAGAYA